MERSELVPDRVYQQNEPNGRYSYFVSPDGDGVYWYDTLREVEAAHGPVSDVEIITGQLSDF